MKVEILPKLSPAPVVWFSMTPESDEDKELLAFIVKRHNALNWDAIVYTDGALGVQLESCMLPSPCWYPPLVDSDTGLEV